jgi:NADPH:quinone reductase-like Zn-dependent oxidoreductase
MSTETTTGLQLRSLITASGELELSLLPVEFPAPGPDEVLVRVEASPINPSDLGLLLGAADPATAKTSGEGDATVVKAKVPPTAAKAMAGRLGESMAVGNEGAGTVVQAGSSPEAQALMGKMVAMIGGAMYAQYRIMKVAACLPLPDGTTAAEGASCFVNPLTSLGMVETMRREGHTALVHTAAASNLGQMLNRICLADGIDLVNIVRSEAQEKLLRDLGAKYVCNSEAPSFTDDLVAALIATGATLAFDATGGGRLQGQILTAMEVMAVKAMKEYSRYGSTTHKQVYVYGRLESKPIEFSPTFGMAWGMGGWLLFPFLQKIGQADAARLRARVAAELKTTFASHYSKEISLHEVLDLDNLHAYAKRATGTKFLINPNKAG